MSTFEINSEALDAAYRAMTGICDTIEAQRAQHSHAHSGIEGMLANAAAVVLATTGLDPFSIWEQWGFGGVAQTCSATHWTVEQVRGTIQQIVGEVSEAHRGELAPVLHDRAMGLRSALDNAQERLRLIISLLNPGNLLQLLTSPWTILDHFSAASGALNLAHSLAQDYRDFLARLSAREKELVEQIITLLESPGIERGADIVEELATGAGAILDLTKGKHLPGVVGNSLVVIDLIADIAKGGKYDSRTIAIDANTAAIGVGISAIPIAGEVYNGLALGSAGMTYMSWGLQGQEQLYQGQSRSQIQQLADEWGNAGKSIDSDPLLHDLGALASDLEGGSIQANTYGLVDPGIGGFSNIPGDVINTAKDTGSLIWGVATLHPAQLLVDTNLVEADVNARAAHAPGWLQGPLDFAAGPAKPAIDAVTNVVTFGWL